MKLAFRCCKVCAAAIALLTFASALHATPNAPKAQAPAAGTQGQSSVLKDLTNDWTRQKTSMMAIADAMPEDKFSYKTTPPQRDFGAQVMHIALVNVQLLKILKGNAPAPTFTPTSVKTKADMLRALSDSYDYGTALLHEQSDATIIQTIQAPAFLGPSTRARIFWSLLSHSMDIYGQMAVYLRMNGVIPPASRSSMP
jgi:uncharacterized damage-inducible protein DinB